MRGNYLKNLNNERRPLVSLAEDEGISIEWPKLGLFCEICKDEIEVDVVTETSDEKENEDRNENKKKKMSHNITTFTTSEKDLERLVLFLTSMFRLPQ